VTSNPSDPKAYNIRDSIAYQIEEQIFECPALEDNPLFQKLRNRLRLFFNQQEDFNKHGISQQQKEQDLKAGVDFRYKIELNKSLK